MLLSGTGSGLRHPPLQAAIKVVLRDPPQSLGLTQGLLRDKLSLPAVLTQQQKPVRSASRARRESAWLKLSLCPASMQRFSATTLTRFSAAGSLGVRFRVHRRAIPAKSWPVSALVVFCHMRVTSNMFSCMNLNLLFCICQSCPHPCSSDVKDKTQGCPLLSPHVFTRNSTPFVVCKSVVIPPVYGCFYFIIVTFDVVFLDRERGRERGEGERHPFVASLIDAFIG